MIASLQHLKLRAIDHMSHRDLHAVLAAARDLEKAAHTGRTPHLLRGKNLALLSEGREGADAMLFHHAAGGLGAQVADIRQSTAGLDTPARVRATARILGRLYDAVECHGLPAPLVEQLNCDAGVPVYDGLAAKVPCALTLGHLLGHPVGPEFRLYMLQALLVATII